MSRLIARYMKHLLDWFLMIKFVQCIYAAILDSNLRKCNYTTSHTLLNHNLIFSVTVIKSSSYNSNMKHAGYYHSAYL